MKIIYHNENNPEDNAMLTAVRSRSGKGVEKDLEDIKSRGGDSGNFMDKFYVGYGHDSIGGCGTANLYLEDISIVAATAVEHSRLFRGQETSTRYIDFSERNYWKPDKPKTPREARNLETYIEIVESLYDAYDIILKSVLEGIRNKHPYTDDMKSKTQWENSTKAYAFDIARGFLPMAAKTQVGWHTTISEFKKHSRLMLMSSNKELSELGARCLDTLETELPHSGFMTDVAKGRFKTKKMIANNFFSLNPVLFNNGRDDSTVINYGLFRGEADLMLLLRTEEREPVPVGFMGGVETIEFTRMIDFGSYRDIHRHNTFNFNYALPSPENLTINPWYLEKVREYAPQLRNVITGVALDTDRARMFEGDHGTMLKQYVLPLGTNVHVHGKTDISGWIHFEELRSSPTVHPTVRIVLDELINALTDPTGKTHRKIYTHPDIAADGPSVARGDAAITEK